MVFFIFRFCDKASQRKYFEDNFDFGSPTTYLAGDAFNNFKESYRLHYVDIPLLFSYGINLYAKKINFRVYLGQDFGIGIAGKCKLTGTTEMPKMLEYYNSNDKPTGETYNVFIDHTGELELFGKSGKLHDKYKAGLEVDYKYEFEAAPFKRFNAGMNLGASFEIYGFNIGFLYNWGLTNMANEKFWTSNRMQINEKYSGGVKMENYKQKLNNFQLKIGYIFRW